MPLFRLFTPRRLYRRAIFFHAAMSDDYYHFTLAIISLRLFSLMSPPRFTPISLFDFPSL